MRALVWLALLTGCATTADAPSTAKIDAAIAGRVAGAAERCIELGRVQGPQILDSRTILYRQSGRRLWRNDLGESCPGLRPDQALLVEPFGDRLCQGDVFTAIDRIGGVPTSKCRFGPFTPYDKVRG